MYYYTVYIPNPPLAIHRRFAFTEIHASTEFAAWLNAKGLKYEYHYMPQDVLTHAIAAVEHELAFAAEGRHE